MVKLSLLRDKPSPPPTIQYYQLENRDRNNGKLQTVGLDRLFGNGHQSFFANIT